MTVLSPLWQPRELREDYPTKAASGPCKGCGEPIQPGQVYVVGGPWHVRCSPPGPWTP